MAKRSRGSSKPGQRRPVQKSTAPARPGGLSAAEEARAAELEAQIVAEERAAEDARNRSRDRARGAATGRANEVARPSRPGLLAQRAEEEYTYVVRDIRRISGVAGGLLGVLAIVYILRAVLHVI